MHGDIKVGRGLRDRNHRGRAKRGVWKIFHMESYNIATKLKNTIWKWDTLNSAWLVKDASFTLWFNNVKPQCKVWDNSLWIADDGDPRDTQNTRLVGKKSIADGSTYFDCKI